MPPSLGGNETDHLICFSNQHSFPTKETLLDHLLNKIDIAELRLVGTNSKQESLSKAREVFTSGVKHAGVKFVSPNNDDDDLPPEYTSVGYHYERDNKHVALSRSKYILERIDAVAEIPKEHATLAKAWVNYFLAQNQFIVGTWFWSCRHRSLDFQGVEGKGIMIEAPEGGEQLEIGWTRLTASRFEQGASSCHGIISYQVMAKDL